MTVAHNVEAFALLAVSPGAFLAGVLALPVARRAGVFVPGAAVLAPDFALRFLSVGFAGFAVDTRDLLAFFVAAIRGQPT